MNWYFLYKFAQSIVPDYDPDDFEEVLTTVYELEYKYSMIKQRPFRGHPKRLENIQNNITSELAEAADTLKYMLVKVYETWLAGHALLDPVAWSENRTQGFEGADFSYGIDNIMGEFVNYTEENIPTYNWDARKANYQQQFFQRLIEVLSQDNLPKNLNALKEGALYGHKEYLRETFLNETAHFNDSYGTEFNLEDQDQAEEYIENISFNDVNIEDMLYLEDASALEDTISRISEYTPYYIDPDGFLTELYSVIVFPLWMAKWGPEGIEDTRNRVENTYQELLGATPDDMGNFLARINLAINEAHQTGDMSDYIEEEYGVYDIQETFTGLTQGNFVEKWNGDLRAIGVQI